MHIVTKITLSFALAIMSDFTALYPVIADSWSGQEGKFDVCYQDLYGLLDKSGKTVLKPTYLDISDFHEGLATFHQGGGAGVIDKTGKVQIKAAFAEIGPYQNGIAAARALLPRKRDPDTGDWECAGLWGLIDRHGSWLVKPTYDYVDCTGKDYIVFTKGKKLGLIGADKKVLAPAVYDEIHELSEGMAAFRQHGKFGYINKEGKVIVPAKYDSVGPFKEGFARVLNADGWGFIDRSGNTVIKNQYKEASSFSDGFALVKSFSEVPRIFCIKAIGSKLEITPSSNGLPFEIDRTHVMQRHSGSAKKGCTNSKKDDAHDTEDDDSEFCEGLCITETKRQAGKQEVMPTSDYVVKTENGSSSFKVSKIYRIRKFHEGLVVFSAPVLVSKKLTKPSSEQKQDYSKVSANPYAEGRCRRNTLNMPRMWGYKDATGKIVIPPIFRKAYNFSEGLADVQEELNTGYIDKTGKYVIQPSFPIGAGSFHSGIAYGTKCSKEFTEKPFRSGHGCVQSSHFYRIGLIDRRGKFITPAIYEDFEPLSEGRRAFRLNDKWGFMDQNGKVVIEPKYAAVQAFSEGMAAVTKKVWNGGFSFYVASSWGYIDKDGKLVIPHKYPVARSFHNGLALVSENDRHDTGKPEGFIDKAGRLQIPSGPYSREFEDGVAVRGLNGKKCLIDSSGKTLTDESYDEFGAADKEERRLIREGLIPVRKGSLWGFIDKAGKSVIAPQFAQVGHFHEGLAVVQLNNDRTAYINRQGQVMLDQNYRTATPFRDGMAIISNDKGQFVIDKNGRQLFDATGIESYSEGLFLWKDPSKEPKKYLYRYEYN